MHYQKKCEFIFLKKYVECILKSKADEYIVLHMDMCGLSIWKTEESMYRVHVHVPWQDNVVGSYFTCITWFIMWWWIKSWSFISLTSQWPKITDLCLMINIWIHKCEHSHYDLHCCHSKTFNSYNSGMLQVYCILKVIPECSLGIHHQDQYFYCNLGLVKALIIWIKYHA